MKRLFLILFFLSSLSAFAKDPQGLYQIDASRSKITLNGSNQVLTGLIDLKEDFLQSHFELVTEEGIFKSHEVSGTKEDFILKGLVHNNGLSQEVILRGSYFGVITQEEGYEKVLFKLQSENCVSSVFALKPKTSTSNLHKVVRDIIQ